MTKGQERISAIILPYSKTTSQDLLHWSLLCLRSSRLGGRCAASIATDAVAVHLERTTGGRRNNGGAIPAAAVDVALYLEARHAGGAAPATRAAIAKVHQVCGLGDPTADSLCRDVLHRIGREGRHRGRGQVAGVGWAQAEAAASLAADGGGGVQGLRDAAIILVMSDTLARISEVAALQCRDVEAYTTEAGGSVHIRASKADQFGEGSTRYIGPATLTAIDRYLQAADHATGPLFRRVLRGCHGSSEPLGADSMLAIIRKRVAVVPGSGGRVGGHSFRVGSARKLAAAGASVAELQQAGGWRSPATPEVYIRREAAARRSRGVATGWAGSLRSAALPPEDRRQIVTHEDCLTANRRRGVRAVSGHRGARLPVTGA